MCFVCVISQQKVPNTSFSYPDKVRGVLNEGGLFGERQGWHLPSFPTSGWASRDLSEGLPNQAAGVGFFVSTFKLDIPKGLDVMLSFTFEEPLGQPYRAFLFVNGWMMGKRVANLGLVFFIHIVVAFFTELGIRPQAKFPVHEGILDYHGEKSASFNDV